MKTSILKKAIPAALLLAGVSGLPSTANASVYSVAYNNIFNLAVSSNPFVPVADFTQFSAVSAAAANLNGDGSSGSNTNGGPADVTIKIAPLSAFGGLPPVNNAMTAQGQFGNYSYSDSQVSQTALQSVGGVISPTGTLTQAWGIAEGYIYTAGNADAATRNSSETGFNSQINLQDATQFTFAFNAAPYMYVAMSANTAGVSSNAFITVELTITDGQGNTVFSWKPDGTLGSGITGGTEAADAFTLNTSKEVTAPGTSALYDPLVSGAPNGTINPGAFGAFSATTNLLAAGIYTISLDMTENTNLSTLTVETPAPGVLALMGLGLAGIGFRLRRK